MVLSFCFVYFHWFLYFFLTVMYTQSVVDRKYSMKKVSNNDVEFWKFFLNPMVYMEKYSDEWGYEIHGMDNLEFVFLCEHYKNLLMLSDGEFYVKYMLDYKDKYTPYVVRLRYYKLMNRSFASF